MTDIVTNHSTSSQVAASVDSANLASASHPSALSPQASDYALHQASTSQHEPELLADEQQLTAAPPAPCCPEQLSPLPDVSELTESLINAQGELKSEDQADEPSAEPVASIEPTLSSSPEPSLAVDSNAELAADEDDQALLELADTLDDDEGNEVLASELSALDEGDELQQLPLEQQLPAKSKHREVLDEHNSKLFREDPRMDRRIIEGMLHDRAMFLEEMIGEGYSSSAVLRRAAELGLSEALIRQVKGVAADLAGERPGRRPAPSSLGARTCLSCDRVFLSSGPGNRLCMRCRGGDAGLAQL